MFPSWCTCSVEGKVSGQPNTCCNSDRDVTETADSLLLHELQSSRLAETRETRDDSPSLKLGHGKQVYAMRTIGTELRVARLLYESETTVDLVTVSNILDCESGCTIKRASDTGTGRLSVVCKERRGVVQQDTRQLAGCDSSCKPSVKKKGEAFDTPCDC